MQIISPYSGGLFQDIGRLHRNCGIASGRAASDIEGHAYRATAAGQGLPGRGEPGSADSVLRNLSVWVPTWRRSAASDACTGRGGNRVK
jgi:hypothetical protein